MHHEGTSPKGASHHFWHFPEESAAPQTDAARLDPEGTAKGKTRIIHHPNRDWCVGPGIALVDPELETEDGSRIPLKESDE